MNFRTENNDFEVNLERLDSSQREAVQSKSDDVVIRASAGSGKALLNGTKVLTKNGWKSIELLDMTDKVAAEDGKFYPLLGIYPQGKKQIYEVEFSDGSVIKCSPDHLWTWQTSDQRNKSNKWQINTIEEISQKPIKLNNGHWNIYIPQTEPINFPTQSLPLDPYLLGVLLGDGSIAGKGIIFTVAEEDIKEKVNNILYKYNCSLVYQDRYDYAIQGDKGFGYHNIQDYVGATITKLGLRGSTSHNKFIPDLYKFSSVEQRLALLQGLIDTDGYCTGSGYDICLKSKQLILDIKWLCESLGATARYSEKDSYCSNTKEGSKNCGKVYRLQIKCSNEIPKIHSSIKREKQWKKGQSSARRTIRNINKTNKYEEMTCIEIQSPNHLFITENCIPTHNTSTLITAVANYRYEHLNDRICAITYTRAARAEMETRLRQMGIYDVEVTTIHVWSRNLLDYFADKYCFPIRILEEGRIKEILKDIVNQYIRRSRVHAININILYTYITGNKTMDITDNYRRTLNALEARYIQYKEDNGLYDFTDYPKYLWDVMQNYDEYVNTIDALFVDEFQDVDETQFKIFQRVNANKRFYIGDPWQCQPEGTKVLIRGQGEKNIEDIEIGDPVVFYDQTEGYVSGAKLPHNAKIKKVLNKECHEFNNDYLITITSENGYKSSYTPNHRTFVRFNKKEGYQVVYLMCDSNYRFRVGQIPMFYSGKTDKTQNPWRDKMRAEKCEKIWLLKVFDNTHDARVEEAKISYQYGIPQTCWQTNKVQWTKEDIDYIYRDLDTFAAASRCLENYQLDIRYPLLDDSIEWSKKSHFTSNASSEIYAINLIPEFMSCLVYSSETSHRNYHAEEIVSVNKHFISSPIKVYSLEVEGGTYVADNIITHNSIFIFRGADGEVFNKLRNFDLFKLKYNYRSYQEIINYATTVYEALKHDAMNESECYITSVNYSHPSSIICSKGYGGNVYSINPYGYCKRFYIEDEEDVNANAILTQFIKEKTNVMILCRTNKQVRAVQEAGYSNVSTVHQAKGLEYDNVIVVDHTISSYEDLNIAYVALTRARNNMLVINWLQLEQFLLRGFI